MVGQYVDRRENVLFVGNSGTINDFSVLGPKHPHTVESLKHLVSPYESWNQPTEVEKWRATLLQTETPEG